ncbi:MAG: aminotransferase class V-fold PLP-dependent enzyme [Ruminococcaceae bacterium]|nr:aminotransferase class V-fold PLP-dependent enzyme [Oscillospiraceae bacterium]
MIYLDNAATTLKKPPQVAEAVLRALQTLGNSSRGTHEGALDAAHTVYGARVKIAKFFGCARADHVIFTSNITESLNIALCGLLRPGDHAISTDLEHNSVLRPLYRLETERGIAVDFVPADRQGCVNYADFERLMRPNTRLIVCTHASNLTGNMVDIRRISDIARAHGALLVVDAAQTAGTRPVDMEALGADVLCFTGHKGLMGPQGTGGLCIREGVEITPFKVGGTGVQTYSKTQPEQYPTRLEAGTLNGHGIAGLSAAIDYLNEVGLDAVQAREAALTRRFYEGARTIDGVTVYGDFCGDRAAIVALNIRGCDSGSVSDALSQDYGIATRPGAHCAPLLHEALGTKAQGAVRFSFSWFTTEDEIDAALYALRELSQNNG